MSGGDVRAHGLGALQLYNCVAERGSPPGARRGERWRTEFVPRCEEENAVHTVPIVRALQHYSLGQARVITEIMGKKRKAPTSEEGVVVTWKTSDDGGNRGFGFIERQNGENIFCHKTHIMDGTALQVGTSVTFEARADPKPDRPDNVAATNVKGGVCFELIYRKFCAFGARCRHSHKPRIVVRAPSPPPLSLEDAAAAVAAGRGADAAPPVLVDTVEACKEQCERLARAGVVAADFEGVNLSRDGEISLVQLAAVDGPVVLVDVDTLGAAAFEVGGLRGLLEDVTVRKLIFDGRADSDALYHLYGVRMAHVTDAQILCTRYLDAEKKAAEAKTAEAGAAGAAEPGGRRPLSSGRLPSFGMALQTCPGLAQQQGSEQAALKRAGHALFERAKESGRAVWKERPLPPALVEYAAADVAPLHTMCAAWGGLVSEAEMTELTTRRFEAAISADVCAKGAHMGERDFT